MDIPNKSRADACNTLNGYWQGLFFAPAVIQHDAWQCPQWLLAGITVSGGNCRWRLRKLLHQSVLSNGVGEARTGLQK